jgi:hypothetical protein
MELRMKPGVGARVSKFSIHKTGGGFIDDV